MAELDVAAYKEAVFGNNGHSSTQPQPQEKPNDEPPAKPADTTVIDKPIEEKPIVETPTKDEDEIVDANEYLKSTLGYDDWETAKADIDALRKKAATPAEIKYANEQSRLLHEAIVAGKTEDVLDILDTQRKLAAVDKMNATDAIKLHIQQNNKTYSPIDIQDVFEEKYAYPEKPVFDETKEDETEFKAREDKWKQAKEKIDRRIERDAATAKGELAKLSAELKLPEIPKPQGEAPTNEEEQKELQRLQAETKEAYSKLSPKDVTMLFKFNDEASKLAFDVSYEPDKESFDKAITLASDMQAFFSNYYDKDGNPDRIRFAKDLYAGQNIEKIVTEAMVAAVNQERVRSLKYQKNIGDGLRKDFVIPPETDVQKLKKQVFG